MKIFCSLIFLVGAVICLISCDDNIIEPCGCDVDQECVKDYFKKHGKCSVVETAKDSVIIEENLPIFLSNINTKVVTMKTSLSPLRGIIEKFYIDKKTNQLIITVSFLSDGINCNAPDTIFAVGRPGKEHKVVKANVEANYRFTVTIVISLTRGGITGRSLQKASYSATFPDSNVSIKIGPEFSQSEDPDIKAAYEKFIADPSISLRQIFATKKSYLALIFLQTSICNFNLNPVLRKYDITAILNTIDAKADDSQLKKPCEQSKNMDSCAREYIRKLGCCSGAGKPLTEPVSRKIFINDMPLLNSSVILTLAKIEGLIGEITNIIENQQTENLIVTMAFKSIKINSPRAHLVIEQNGQQSKVISGYSKTSYPVDLTATIPISKGLTDAAFNEMVVYSLFTGTSTYNLGPEYTESKDPQMRAIMEDVMANPNIVGQQLFETEGPYAMLKNLLSICDFGGKRRKGHRGKSHWEN